MKFIVPSFFDADFSESKPWTIAGKTLEVWIMDTTLRQHLQNLRGLFKGHDWMPGFQSLFVATSLALHLGIWMSVQTSLLLKGSEDIKDLHKAAAQTIEISMVNPMDFDVDEAFDDRSDILMKVKKKHQQESKASQLLKRIQALGISGARLRINSQAAVLDSAALREAMLSAGVGAGAANGKPLSAEAWAQLQQQLNEKNAKVQKNSESVQKLRSFLVSQRSLFQGCYGKARAQDPQLAGSLKTQVGVSTQGRLDSSHLEFSGTGPGVGALKSCVESSLRALAFPSLTEPTSVQFQLLFAG